VALSDIQTIAVILWVAMYIVAAASGWDPYPFVLLNLLFSVQASTPKNPSRPGQPVRLQRV
jgi:hypothetical protein